MNPDVRYFIAVLLRRLPVFLVVAVGISAVSFLIAIILPTSYSSNARLLVETSQIPGDLAQSTVQVNAGEQLQVIEQKLLTRANLIAIARKHEIFENINEMTPDQIVRRMRNATTLKSSTGRDSATLMQVEFFARTPRLASAVVNEYVTRIMEENVRQRTGRAGGTLEFFEQEVERLSTELSVRSARILEFKNANAEALPDTLEFRLNRQTTLDERKAQLENDLRSLQNQRERLVQIYNATGQLAQGNIQQRTPEEAQLASAKDELAKARAVFSDSNPKVKLLRARVEQLQAVVNAQVGVTEVPDSGSILDVQLTELDARAETIKESIAQIQPQLDELAGTISRTASNAVTLEGLQREHDNIRDQYNLAVERLSAAATGERIEVERKGQSIAVIEQATEPTEPASPNRPLIAIGGTMLGITAGGALVFLLEVLNKSIRRPAQLTNALGITPLATIPYIETYAPGRQTPPSQAAGIAVLCLGLTLVFAGSATQAAMAPTRGAPVLADAGPVGADVETLH